MIPIHHREVCQSTRLYTLVIKYVIARQNKKIACYDGPCMASLYSTCIIITAYKKAIDLFCMQTCAERLEEGCV